MTSDHAYPLRVDATLDPRLSRGLWLVKWLLALPHYIVLAFLWLAFAVLSVVALVAILVTGRYPRTIFDFNVGVLRWTWRVAVYAYAALGTDRYPPFTLAEVADYPAHLTVEYPERLSRGLVLVKWWLLALPHYLVVSILVGGALHLSRSDTPGSAAWGLIGLLVLVAAVILLFTGRYPGQLFDLVIGLNRWVLRVAAYAALMTDVYPPFRLDLGGTEDPVTSSPSDTRPAGGATPPVPFDSDPVRPPSRWTSGPVVTLVLGCVALLLGTGLLGAAAFTAVVDRDLRDSDGYLMSEPIDLSTSGYALTSSDVRLETEAPVDLPGRLLGEAKVVVTPTGGDRMFMGITETSEAERYLADVEHSVLTGFSGKTPELDEVSGETEPADPESGARWAESASGTGTQVLTWPVEAGDWTLVVLNADGSPEVAAQVAIGATLPVLDDLLVVLLVAGSALLVVGAAIVAGANHAASRERVS